jgi:hypothetical protein
MIHIRIWGNGEIILMEKLKDSKKYLSQCHCVYNKSHIDYPGNKARHVQSDACAMAQLLFVQFMNCVCPKPKYFSQGLPLSLHHNHIIEDPSLDVDPLRCQQDMEAEVGHQAAGVDLLHQAVVAIPPRLQALVNASALQEKAA